jgi:hypothetical protein
MTKTKSDRDRTDLEQLDVTSHPARDAAHFRRILAARDSLQAAEKGLFTLDRAVW